MNLRTYLMIKTAARTMDSFSPETIAKREAMRKRTGDTGGTVTDEVRSKRESVSAPKSRWAREHGLTDADMKSDRGISSLSKARVGMRNFINAERGRALLGASMLDPRVNTLGRSLGAGAMIGGGGLAGAGLGAVGGLSAADALGLDADSDSYLARLGRYGLAGGGAALGGIGGAGLGAIGAGHVLGGRISQRELNRAMRKNDRLVAGLSPNTSAAELAAIRSSALGDLPSTLAIRSGIAS